MEIEITENVKNNAFRRTTVRDLFAQYFYTSGAIEQQWRKAYTSDFLIKCYMKNKLLLCHLI